MLIIVDSDILIEAQSEEPLPGAVDAMKEIATYDQLAYISLMDTDTLNAVLQRHSFSTAQLTISCSHESEKLQAILSHIHSNKRFTLISTAQVLKALDTDSVWNNYPQAAATLASSFTFIIYGVKQVEQDLLPYAEFPLEALSSWQEITIAAET